MKKFLILGLAAAAIALLGQPTFANPPQRPIVLAHPMGKAPAFRPQPMMGGQHAALGQRPVNLFQANRPGFAPHAFNGFQADRSGDHRAVASRYGYAGQLHREQLVRHEELRNERRDRRIAARQQSQADQADQSAADDSSAQADSSSGSNLADTISTLKSVLDLFNHKNQ